ncbi:M23 family metallopeptidase [Microbacterium resistens]|uniref:M23 family metallopeptidase n=1 Tax=Microbacterium resistens TaxID=156977 RepID=A0ABY3RXF0_9MICO|nr:M23 family metallopeptidase [Microbacterium resistens]UGS27574.1 M23 family metallopeptidase [Microbacterium resistens]
MARDLNDAWGWIERLVRRVDRLYSGAMLENSSITNGRMRFIGGLLLIDSGGTLQVIGQLVGEGDFRWVGPWTLEGPGTISGDTVGTGKLDWRGLWNLIGNGTIEGDVLGTGKLTWNGLWEMVGAGKIRGDVEVLDNGKLRIGNMIIDPTEGGSISFPGGAKVQADPNGGARIIQGNNRAYVGPNLVSLQYGADKSIALSNSGITVRGAPVDGSGVGLSWLGIDPTSKQLYEVQSNTGGPHGSLLMWPFPPNTVTDEFGPREPGESGSAFHQGIDFGTGGVTTGSPIPAAAAGTVILAGDNGGYGNCVIIDHGGSPNLKTLYAHMDTAPLVSVGQVVNRGQILGPVGNTGQSFGAHLHFEVHVDGVPVNPRSKLPQQI